MRSHFRLLTLATLFFAFSAGAEAKKTRAVKFKQDLFTQTAKIGTEFRISNLRTLLSEVGSGNLQWQLFAEAPTDWLTIQGEAMFGTPKATNLGKKKFRFGVRDLDDTESGTAIAQMEIEVLGAPEWSNTNIDLGIQNEGVAMTPFDLKPFVKNTAGGALTFSSPNLKAWMKLSSDGLITGTPARKDVGKYTGITLIATGVGGASQATGFGEVLITIKPPEWKANPITLEDTNEDAPYAKDISSHVNNFEQTALTFKKVSGPDWLAVAPNGVLSGTPVKKDIGAVTLTVSFTTTVNGTVYTKNTVFKFNVIHVNHAPKWVANPITLPNAATGVAYSQNISSSASDPDDGDTLTFSVVTGPTWVKVDATGKLSGTPGKANIGQNTVEVKVADKAGLNATTKFLILVIKSNEPPVWLTKPVVLPNAFEDKSYTADLTVHVKDPDGDALAFTVINAPAWAKVSSAGFLSGTPSAADVGLNKLTVRVTDSISGNDTADILIDVIHVNHAPEWLLNPIRITVNEKAAMNQSIAGFARDVDDGDELAFQMLTGGPAWAKLSADGTFTGTPLSANIGDNVYSVRVTDKAGLFADATVIIEVRNVNDKPYWTKDPIVLANAKEGVSYVAGVAEFAKDDDPNDVLTFSKVSGPSWLSVSSTGAVSGTPTRQNVGLNTFQVRVMDLASEFAVVTVQITVEKVNTPPRWRQNPILMGDGFEEKPYTFDLALYAVDDDGDALTFTLLPGSPSWMTVTSAGKVTGTPKKADIGAFLANFQVSDGKATADAQGKGQVLKTTHPPEISGEMPVFIVKERESLKVSLTNYVTDADGDTLTFTLTNTPNWITFFQNGEMTLAPLHAHLGDHTFQFSASDGEYNVPGTIRVRVLENPRPPIWTQDPINMSGKTNEKFTGDISPFALELDGRPLTFSKKSGPAWLTVAANGQLTGTPLDANFGVNAFEVTTCNDKALCATVKLNINVDWGTTKEEIAIDKAVPGARAENLWVIDNSNNCSKVLQSLKANVKFYVEELNKAGIHHSGLYLSSDAHKYDGLPFKGAGGNWLLKWDQANWVSDFTGRMDKAIFEATRGLTEDDSRCGGGNCYNSPIWSMFRWYERAPSHEIYQNGYFSKSVPMDVMVVSQQRDHYKWYTQNKPQKNWTPTDFAEEFVKFSKKQEQPYRISAIAPECPKLSTEESGWAGPENTYRTIVTKTGGVYYPANDCNFNLKPHMLDYAKKVIFRAYVHAKNRIKLSKIPKDPSTLKVSVGGVLLPGNTGATTDMWKYDVTTNEVILFWHLIDEGQLKPGDMLKIEYRVS